MKSPHGDRCRDPRRGRAGRCCDWHEGRPVRTTSAGMAPAIREGRVGEDIPVSGRIVIVADNFDALLVPAAVQGRVAGAAARRRRSASSAAASSTPRSSRPSRRVGAGAARARAFTHRRRARAAPCRALGTMDADVLAGRASGTHEAGGLECTARGAWPRSARRGARATACSVASASRDAPTAAATPIRSVSQSRSGCATRYAGSIASEARPRGSRSPAS